MLHATSRRAVEAATCGRAGAFRRPLYDSYSFARLPATVEYLLTGDDGARGRALPLDALGDHARRHESVVLVCLDGFGWQLLERFLPASPLLQRFLDEGVVTALTAQFPSTTAAHMTTLHTGLPVGQSGVHEWFYYEPAADAVVAPLLFSRAGDHARETLQARGLRPADLFPFPTVYQRLAAAGVRCAAHQDEAYARSSYSDQMFAGAAVRPYPNVAAGLAALADELLSTPGRRYHFFYVDVVDSRAHSQGLDAPEFAATVAAVLRQLEGFLERVRGQAGDAVLLVTADHGLTPVDPATTVYVNRALPDLPGRLRVNAQGEVLRFGGSCRDLFLYARAGQLPELEARLNELLVGKAEVWRTDELLAAGFFGPPPYDRLRPRLGDLVVLPYAGQSVFWQEGRFTMKHRASHGGLTPEEMDTGLYLLPL